MVEFIKTFPWFKGIGFAVLGLVVISAIVLLVRPIRQNVMALVFGLPAPQYAVTIKDDVFVAPDGVKLTATIHSPVGAVNPPIVLIRTPYGRRRLAMPAGLFAERGFRVYIQDARGTGDSEGDFMPLINERADGAATVDHVRRSDWFGGRLYAWGPSYMGYTALAAAIERPNAFDAVSVQVTMPDFHSVFYPNGAFSLELAALWTKVNQQFVQTGWAPTNVIKSMQNLEALKQTDLSPLPYAELDHVLTGETIDYYQIFTTQPDAETEYWRAVNLENDISKIESPVHIYAGWFDVALKHTIKIYDILDRAGRRPSLTVGPYTHTDVGLLSSSLGDLVTGFKDQKETSVRYLGIGEKVWSNADVWPVTPSRTLTLWPDSSATLTAAKLDEEQQRSFVFDPEQPTPAFGGPRLFDSKAQVNNKPLEARDDVLVYTTAPFEVATNIVGSPKVILDVDVSTPSADFFVRLNKVNRKGRSTNLSEGIMRADGTPQQRRTIEFALGATAFVVRPGERLRLVVAGGAFPKYAANLGDGDLATQARSVTKRPSTRTIYQGGQSATSLSLPVRDGS